jgi:hypothetical protein
MTDTMPTREQLLADWTHLGTDALATNTRNALDTAGITPAAAAAMDPKDLAATPGLGVARLERVHHHLARIAAYTWHDEQLAAVEKQKTQPGHCGHCGGRRATHARNVTRNIWGQLRHVNPRTVIRLDDCDNCDTHHRELVQARALELAGRLA